MKRYMPKLGRLARFGIAYTFGAMLQKGIGFVIFMYFANIFSVKEYAAFGINYSIFTVISALAFSGIIEAVIGLMREHKANKTFHELFKAANSVFAVLAVSASVLVSITVFLLYRHNLDNNFEIIIIALGAAFSSLFIFQSTLVRLEEQHILSILLLIVPSIIGYFCGLTAVLFFKTGFSYFAGTLLSYAICLVLFLVNKRNFTGFSFDKTYIKKIVNRISPYIIIAILGWLLGYGNTFLVKYLFNDLQVAIFVFLLTISSILQLVATSMNQVWAPRFFINYDKDPIHLLEEKNQKFTIIQGLVLGAIGAMIILIFPLLISYFHNLEKYSNNKLEMFCLFGGYIVSIPWWHSQNYFMINDNGKSLMNLTIVSGVVGYLLWIFCMFFLGSKGIYVGFFTQMLIRTIIVFTKAKKNWDIKFDWLGILFGMVILLAGVLLA